MKKETEDFLKHNSFISDQKTRNESDFLEKFITPASTVLDIGCGSGRNSLELANRGYIVTGIDIDSEVIAYADNLKVPHKSPSFYVKDFFTMDLKEQYDLALMMYHTFSFAVTNDQALKLLKNIHRHLKPEGFFIFHLFSEWKIIGEGNIYGSQGINEIEEKDGIRVQETKTTIFQSNNIRRQDYESSIRRGDEIEIVSSQYYNMRIYSYSEIDLLCRLCGFEISGVYSGDSYDQKILDFYEMNTELRGCQTMYVLKRVAF